MKKIIHLLSFLALMSTHGLAQDWEWQENASGEDYLAAIVHLPDGDFIALGTDPNPSDLSVQAYLVKINAIGEKVWSKRIPDDLSLNVRGLDMILSTDNHLIITGAIRVINGGTSDVLLAKYTLEGDLVWLKSIDNSNWEFAMALAETADGGFLMVGGTEFTPNCITPGQYPLCETNGRSLMVKTDAEGEVEWINSYGATGVFYDVLETSNGNFASIGYQSTISEEDKDVFLIQTNPTGDSIWAQTWGNAGKDLGYALIADADSIIVVGQIVEEADSVKVFVAKVDNLGQPLWSKSIGQQQAQVAYDISPIDEQTYALTGWALNHSREVLFLKIDQQGHTLRKRTYPLSFRFAYGVSIIPTMDSGFAIAGTRFNPTTFDDFSLLKTDSLGNSRFRLISGTVFHDLNENCSLDAAELGLENWLIRAEGSTSFYGISDKNGNYLIRTDTGDYTLELALPNDYWAACSNETPITIPLNSDTIVQDWAVAAIQDCPRLTVNVATPSLSPCEDHHYTIRYQNQGTTLAENVNIHLKLDSLLTYNFASIPHDSLGEFEYAFLIGDVPAGAVNSFSINVSLDCAATMGQTHTVEARISPDSLCFTPHPDWDGSLLQLNSACSNDSVRFQLKNIGADMQDSLHYIVIQDEILGLAPTYETDKFQLEAEEQINFAYEANGNTFRVEAKQATEHPFSNIITNAVEGCRSDMSQAIALGFITQYPIEDALPFVQTDYTESTLILPPYAQKAYPKGYADANIIAPNTSIEYQINFDILDTIFLDSTNFMLRPIQNVIIIDSLSSHLNPISLKMEAASHPYRFELLENGQLAVFFENISFDETLPETIARKGFVRFTIDQKANLVAGTTIENKVHLILNYGQEVPTDSYQHNIASPLLEITTLALCEGELWEGMSVTDGQIIIDTIDFAFNTIINEQYFSVLENDFQTIALDFFGDTLICDQVIQQDTVLTCWYQNQMGCDSIVEYQLRLMTSINIPEISRMRLFPNPSSEVLTLQFNDVIPAKCQLRILDGLGRLVGDYDLNMPFDNTLNIPVHHLPSGRYVVFVENEYGVLTIPFVKL